MIAWAAAVLFFLTAWTYPRAAYVTVPLALGFAAAIVRDSAWTCELLWRRGDPEPALRIIGAALLPLTATVLAVLMPQPKAVIGPEPPRPQP